jgi:hypothetical protein
MDIITKILFDTYGNVITENDLTPSMAEESKEVCLDKGTEAPSILRNRFVNDSNGWVSTDELKYIFKPAQLSDTKLGVFLKERGNVSSKKMIEGRQVCGYKGLKVIIHSESDDGEEENAST